MALIQSGSTLNGPTIGVTELVYACDGCEAETGNPYENVVSARADSEGVLDWTEFEGWTWFGDPGPYSRTYCPACSDRAAELRALIGEEAVG